MLVCKGDVPVEDCGVRKDLANTAVIIMIIIITIVIIIIIMIIIIIKVQSPTSP